MVRGDIDIWVADLVGCEAPLLDLDAEQSILSDAERQRARGMADEDAANRWMATHVALHLALRQRIAGPINFETGGGGVGKPRVTGWGGDFSLSHSGSVAAVAVGDVVGIGIDLEVPRDVRIDDRRRALIEAAAGVLASQGVLRQPGRNGPFFASWTCLEALAKASGFGMGRLLTALEITGHGGGDVRARAEELAQGPLAGLVVAPIDLGRPGVAASLARPAAADPGAVREFPMERRALNALAFAR